jgi:hypothetical protein
MKAILISTCCLLLSACTTTRPGPDVFDSAQKSIQLAEQAGGDEFAPVEMRFAREKLEVAQLGIEKQKFEVAVYLLEQAEINAELAIEKSRTAKSRRKVNELRKSNNELKQNLNESFGDEFK